LLKSLGLPLHGGSESIADVPPTTAAVASSPKLLDRVRWQLRVKHYSIRTKPTLRIMLGEKMFAFYYERSSNSR
jgi:hypothetical protein